MISIVLPTYKHFEDCLKPCVESILQHTDFKDVELIVVANGCENDGTMEYLNGLYEFSSNIKTVYCSYPLGYTKAIKLGIEASKGDYIVLLNNDTIILNDNWLDLLVEPFLHDETVAITGAAKNYHEPTQSEFLLFFCAMLKKDIMERVGGIDTIFNPGYGEDIDFCIRARKMGYKVVQVPNDITLTQVRPEDKHVLDFPIWHKGSVTVQEVPDWGEVVPRNEQILLDRYGKKMKVFYLENIFDTLNFDSITPQIDRITSQLEGNWMIRMKVTDRIHMTLSSEGYIHNVFVGKDGMEHIRKVNTVADTSSPESIREFVLNAGSKQLPIFGGRWEGGYCVQQDPTEIANFLYDIKDLDIQEYLEIGCADGGVTRLVCDVAKVTNITTLDLGWADMNWRYNYRNNLENTHAKSIRIFRGDSHSERADSFLSGRKYDVIFVDGDHSYEGAYADTQLAKRHAKPGAIIAFHDHLFISEVSELCKNLMKDPELEFVKSYEGPKDTQKGICTFRYKPNPIGEKTSIIIPTYNHLEDCLKPCLRSIINTTDLSNTEVIVVANGCTDGTRQYVESLGDPFHLIWIDEPVGFIKATNAGIRAATGDYIVFLNNDTEVTGRNWLDILKKPFSNPKVGVTGPYKDWRFYWEDNVLSFREEYIVFYCAMTRRSIIEKIGLLDEDFGMGYEEDIDFCVRAKKAGYKLVQVPTNIEDDLSITKDYLLTNPNQLWREFPLIHKDKGTFTEQPPLEWLAKNTSLLKKYADKPRISIVIPTHNNLDYLKRCLESIKTYTNLEEIEIIVVANGCTENTREYVQFLGAPFKLLWMKERAGYIKATNAGIKQSMGDFIVLLNNDTQLLPQEKDEWLKLLLTRFVDNVGIVGPIKSWRDIVNRSYLLFWCVMIKREVFQKIGLLDEGFGEGYHEDVDFCIRAENAGYKLVQTPKDVNYIDGIADDIRTDAFPILHVGGGTFQPLYGDSPERLQKHVQHLYDKHTKRRVIDCCTFFNELDVLKMRMEELDSVVDKFVIVEATSTHQGSPKSLNFEENRARFAKFLHKIHYVVVEFPENLTTWGRENYQRDGIAEGLKDCQPNDIIIISDCDEIVKADVVRNYNPSQGVCAVEMDLFYYDWLTKADKKWYKARILPYSILKEKSPQYFRGEGDYTYDSIIPDGGWHFSFNGTPQQIIEKLEAYGHEEFNNDRYKNEEYISNCIEKGIDLFGRDIKFSKPKRDNSKTKIYDCFSFFNELDLLEIRLNELDDYVDYFVLCEMPVTHSGHQKPLYYQENKERFKKWEHKIIHLIANDPPHIPDPWLREHYQRDYMMNVLLPLPDNTIVIISDLDEIPRGKTISSFKGEIAFFEQNQFSYFLNYNVGIARIDQSTFSRITTLGYIRKKELTLTGVRYQKLTNHQRIPDGGWHFSWMGGGERIVDKLEAWAHQELNQEQYKDAFNIEMNIADGRDNFGKEHKNRYTEKWEIDESFPKFVQDNQDYLSEKGLLDVSKVAIIMPYFNDDRLVDAVSAIMQQTFQNWKLFIVDDGSSKKAVNILANHPKIHILEKENGGPASARNLALERVLDGTTFTHIAFCDSDDVWDKDYLMKQLSIKSDVVYSSVRHRFENGSIAIPWGIPDPAEFPGYEKMLETPFIFISSVVCKKKCFREKRFDTRLDSIEDWDMWLRLAKDGEFFTHNKEKLVTYTVKSGGMASQRTEEKLKLLKTNHHG